MIPTGKAAEDLIRRMRSGEPPPADWPKPSPPYVKRGPIAELVDQKKAERGR